MTWFPTTSMSCPRTPSLIKRTGSRKPIPWYLLPTRPPPVSPTSTRPPTRSPHSKAPPTTPGDHRRVSRFFFVRAQHCCARPGQHHRNLQPPELSDISDSRAAHPLLQIQIFFLLLLRKTED